MVHEGHPRPEHEEHVTIASTQAMTGIAGLDEVLTGGMLRGYMYIVEGQAGTGKTTLCTQFLLEGRAHEEPCLLITTAETRDELAATAQSHGWSWAGIEILE